MNSSPPIPTDNIFKFCAVFGLALLMSSIVSASIMTTNSNEKIISYYEKIYSLQKDGKIDKAEEDLNKIYKEMIQAIDTDRKFINDALIYIFIAGSFISGFGFLWWYTKYQPKQNELLDLQIERIKQELISPSNPQEHHERAQGSRLEK